MINESLLYLDTEKPSQKYPVMALIEIQTRYAFALPHINGKNVVEFGPGSGMAISDMSKVVSSYHGVELSIANYDYLTKTYVNSKMSFSHTNAENFEKINTDIFLAFAMIYYCDLDALIANAKKSLNVGGKFIFCQTNTSHVAFKPSRNTKRYYSLETLHQKFEEHGFELEVYRRPSSEIKKIKVYQFLVGKILPRLRAKLPEKVNLHQAYEFEKIPNIYADDTWSTVHYFVAVKK